MTRTEALTQERDLLTRAQTSTDVEIICDRIEWLESLTEEEFVTAEQQALTFSI